MNTKSIIFTGVVALSLPALAVFQPQGRTARYGELRSHETVGMQKSAGIAETPAADRPARSLGTVGGIETVEKYGELTELFGEDFSLCSAGSEEEPDMNVVLNIPSGDPDFQYPWNNMKPEYYHGDHRWGIEGAYPAGGAIAFPISSMNPQGHVVTPIWDLTANDGSFVVEFRARINTPTPPEHMILVEVAETNNWAPTWDTFDNEVTFGSLSTEWSTLRCVFQKGGPTTIVNIVGMAAAECTILVDDVKVYSLKPYVQTPVLTRHTEFADDSFRVNWKPVEGADKYKVSVWTEEEGQRIYVLEDAETAETSMKAEGVDPRATYWFDVRAIAGDKESLLPLPREVFDIVAPAEITSTADPDGITFTSKVADVESAYGYSFTAMHQRTAQADGPFVITDEQFTGWKHPGLKPDQLGPDGLPIYTIENPWDHTSSYYFPLDINQQGWHGENFMTYHDFIAIDSFFWETGRQQSGWISPEMDLSKDGGKIDISMKLAAAKSVIYDENNTPYTYYAYCIVGLFNWNEELGDYEQVESVICDNLNTQWSDRTVTLTKGSERSIIGFFAAGSYDNLYMDDIKIVQNYKKDEVFYDPFHFRTWQLADEAYIDGRDKAEFTYTVPDYASGKPVYARAQAVRYEGGQYSSKQVESPFTANTYVGETQEYSGVNLVASDKGNGSASVQDGVLTVLNPDGETVVLCSLDGKAVVLGNATTISRRIDAGVYVVRVGDKNIKLIN